MRRFIVEKIPLIGEEGLLNVGQALASLHGPLYIVAIIGCARQGKSTILNHLGARLAKHEDTCVWFTCGVDVFKTSSENDPCTVGVDMVVILRKENAGNWILLDCEGLFMRQQIENVSVTKLVALVSQLCSTLLFLDHQMDERMLMALGEKVLFQAIAADQAKYPQLIMVLNRYHLNLNNVPQVKVFLESHRSGAHSRTAELLLDAFPTAERVAVPDSAKTEQFNAALDTLAEMVIMHTKPFSKTIPSSGNRGGGGGGYPNGVVVNGQIWETYVQELFRQRPNSAFTPVDALNSAIQSLLRQMSEPVFARYLDVVIQDILNNRDVTIASLPEAHKTLARQILVKFKNDAHKLGPFKEELVDSVNRLQDKMQADVGRILKEFPLYCDHSNRWDNPFHPGPPIDGPYTCKDHACSEIPCKKRKYSDTVGLVKGFLKHPKKVVGGVELWECGRKDGETYPCNGKGHLHETGCLTCRHCRQEIKMAGCHVKCRRCGTEKRVDEPVSNVQTQAHQHPLSSTPLNSTFSEETHEANINGVDFKILHDIGSGSSGVVYKCRRLSDGKLVVVKRISHRHTNSHEFDIVKTVRHQHIVEIYDCGCDRHFGYVVQQLLNCSLKLTEPVSEPLLRKYSGQLVSAVTYLHSLGIVHRDIKPSNVCLDSEGNVRLIDFGLACFVENGEPSRSVGTLLYMAPEVVQMLHLPSLSSDVWSLGMTVLVLALGGLPQYLKEVTATEEITSRVRAADCDRLLEGHLIPPALRTFLSKCLVRDRKSRSMCVELANDPFCSIATGLV